MLNADQIRKLIVVRLHVLEGCKDHDYLYQHVGVIRGLLWAINGKDPGDIGRRDTVLDLINVPYDRDEDDKIWIDETWLKDNNIDPFKW
jgi:hypothetical protein